MVQLEINQHWLGNALKPNKQQAITQTDPDQVQYRLRVSLGDNDYHKLHIALS